jgi:hypothetical protein
VLFGGADVGETVRYPHGPGILFDRNKAVNLSSRQPLTGAGFVLYISGNLAASHAKQNRETNEG